MNRTELPTNEKILLSLSEAAELSHIGINKLRSVAKKPSCPFAFHKGKNILIKREAFEEYLKSNIYL